MPKGKELSLIGALRQVRGPSRNIFQGLGDARDERVEGQMNQMETNPDFVRARQLEETTENYFGRQHPKEPDEQRMKRYGEASAARASMSGKDAFGYYRRK